MLNTFIKNRGTTKTIIHNNKKNNISEINWDADYDGNIANLSLNLDNNGNHEKYKISLDNNDLANILNLDSINMPLEKRLLRDFKNKSRPKIIQIELEDSEKPFLSQSLQPIMHKQMLREEPILLENPMSREEPISIEELISQQKQHISSPLPNEEFIIPLTIDDKTSNNFTFTTNRHHRKPKTQKKYKVYKHNKPYTRSKSTRSKTSRKSKLLSSNLFSLL
jgi:hypothetical protein